MYGAGRSELAVDFRVPAFKAFLAHINIMFHADITGFPIGMIHTGFQGHSSLFDFVAKGFEFIVDLNNWRQLKSFQDEFVNLFIISLSVKKQNPK